MSEIQRPEIVTDEHLEYLDELRESGVTNMFGAGEFLERRYNIEKKDAHEILNYWMKTFGERQLREGIVIRPR